MKPVVPATKPAVRVLIIEDDEDDQELFTIQLRKTRFLDHVLFVNNGKKALELLTKPNSEINHSDILAIFLDLNLPGIGGLELLRRIRESRKWANLPVFVMSGSTDPRDEEACRQLGVLSFVAKPVPMTTFTMLLANVFEPVVPKDVSITRHY